MIREIELEKLRQHPDNPRKEYRDIEELAESIKAQGILQNLTVVSNPDEKDTYLVVIGNRRLAAAKLAGLTVAPCSVVDMDQKTQASTMLLENMQRNDLSICEQATGFQMCLDLGMTRAELSEKTGLSQTTIRHRLEIARLDRDTLKKREQSEGFQLTIKDLCELEKVEDIKTRNRILQDAANSRDLVWKAQSAVREEKQKKMKRL